jgi:hypothetical protein
MGDEVQTFLLENQGVLAGQQVGDMETLEMKVDDLEAALPDDLFPTLEKSDKEVIVDKVDKDKGKKKKAWGPVQATRQSSRVDTSINVMKKAIEYKKRSNLEEPNKKMKGIM